MKRVKQGIQYIYQAIKKISGEAASHRLRTGLLGALCAAVLVGAVVVLPILASETGEEPTTEVVTEEELEPTQTPDMTAEPIETELPDTQEPTEELEKKEEQDEQGEESDEEQPSESQEQDGQGENDDYQLPATDQQGTQGQGNSWTTDTENGESTPKIKPMASVKLAKPTYKVTERGEGPYTYPLSDPIRIGIEATGPEGAGIDYQWYVRTSEKGPGEKIIGAISPTYTIPKDTDAGDYFYYCEIKSVDIDGINQDSDIQQTSNIVVTIGKGEPVLDDFDTSVIQNEYYYTGQAINPTIVSKRKGMGNAVIVKKDGNNYNQPKAESKDGPFPIYLRVSEGDNYTAKTIDLERTLTIRRIQTPSKPYTIGGTKGNLVDGKQWYTKPVTIKPANGYSISTTEENFQSELTYDTDGEDKGPAVIYLRSESNGNTKGAITDAVTVTEKRDGMINIDTTDPEASILYSNDHVSNNMTKEPLVFSLDATDSGSGVARDKCYYYISRDKSLTDAEVRKLSSSSWKIWNEGDTVTIEEEGSFNLYARVYDKAGNVSYASTEQLTIDQTDPVIKCNGKEISLQEAYTYTADEKTIVISDKNLQKVLVNQEDRSASIVDGEVQIALIGPQDESQADVTYTVTVEDKATNQTNMTITLKNPYREVEVGEVAFGSGEDSQTLTYGYSQVEPKEVILSRADGTKVPVDSLEIKTGDASFEVASVSGSNNKTGVRPKSGLHAGTYEAAIRVNWEEESTMTFRCSLTVEKARMLVRLKEQNIYYHTCLTALGSENLEDPKNLKNLENIFDFTEAEFKNNDKVDTLKKDEEFEWPSFSYVDEEGEQQPLYYNTPIVRDTQIKADGGNSHDYEFEFVVGDLNVTRRHFGGYDIIGNRVDGFEWWSSPEVTIQAKTGYRLSESEDENSFGSGLTFTVEEPTPSEGETNRFYVMNDKTGEISLETTENIKIDTTAPVFRDGEGIIVSNDPFAEFMNDITFGIFFNDTKAVTITATDEESGLESIEYCVDGRALGINDMDELNWQTYDNGFSISPEEYGRAVIYAKITNHAGLVTYISSNGMIFDNKQPEINKVENGKEQAIIDEKEYITEKLNLKVSDRNLLNVTLYEGTNTIASGSALQIVGDDNSIKEATKEIRCPKTGSQTYTVIASDEGKNYAEREFTITKPIYDIKANTLKIKPVEYGYETSPQVPVTWENGETANADATVVDVKLGNTKQFEVIQTGSSFRIAAKPELEAGSYSTDVTLVYNDNKETKTTCSFTVEKATLTAAYTGDDLYYHEKIKSSSVKVTGFVKHNGVLETPETAAGYVEPVVLEDGFAEETCELTPSGGKADNYKFVYRSGLLLVNRRHATAGKDGQFYVDSNISDSGWYTSDIVIRPKEGYALLLNETDAETQESIVLTKETDQGQKDFYITDINTGEIYNLTTFYYKKDTVSPVIKGIEDGVTYEANTKEITVEDDYLTSITVNGEAKPVVPGGTKLTLFAEQETMVYVVVATDCAGNVTSKSIVMNQLGSVSKNPETDPDKEPETDPEENKEDDITATPLPTATPKAGDSSETKSGTVKKLVKVVQGAPNTSLTTSTGELKTSVLNSGEQQAVGTGSNANIELRIKNIDSSVPQGDKELLIANLNGYSVAEYLDITLWKKVGSSSQKKVTSTNKPVTITISIPQSLQKLSREFAILRVHGGSVSVLSDRDSAANTVTFATDKFSTYVLAYKQGSGSRSGGSVSGGSSGSTGYSTYYDASPETGDKAPIVPVSIAFVVSLAGILATLTIRRRTR